MKLENQVCTLKQAKKIKDLGIAQHPALYYFYEEIVNGQQSMVIRPLWIRTWSDDEDSECLLDALNGESKNEIYAAFNVAELGVMLPERIGRYILQQCAPCESTEYNWTACYIMELGSMADEGDTLVFADGKTEAEARAELLIHLLEVDKIIACDVNQRLATS